MKVTLLSYTPDPERVAAAAARQCYSKFSATKAYRDLSPEDISRLLKKIISSGHLSVLEHASFTFSIDGISRACSHQLVRHRIASYSQQSQRYVRLEEIEFVVPESVSKDDEARRVFVEGLERCRSAYKFLLERGIPAEDARYVLPQASPTKIVVTMNARSLLNFFELRCCLSAQWEIRALAEEMLSLVKGVAPTIFGCAGPFCVTRKTCPEKKYDCPKWVELYKSGTASSGNGGAYANQ
ncbi:MAG: FAD-dependent thymidylate synthase [Candidatus Verstraetearchaeota archaeon]|nr:FAD-dependent thymidylate synthase [Candidatus Verstraetearchaeota archaeon]